MYFILCFSYDIRLEMEKEKEAQSDTHTHARLLSGADQNTFPLSQGLHCCGHRCGLGGGMSCSSFTYCLQKTHIPAVVNGVTQSTRLPKFPFLVIIFTPDLTGIFFLLN